MQPRGRAKRGPPARGNPYMTSTSFSVLDTLSAKSIYAVFVCPQIWAISCPPLRGRRIWKPHLRRAIGARLMAGERAGAHIEAERNLSERRIGKKRGGREGGRQGGRGRGAAAADGVTDRLAE